MSAKLSTALAPDTAESVAAEPAARPFLAPELGATIGPDGEIAGVGMRQILKDPQLRQMAMGLWRHLQHGPVADEATLKESALTPADIWGPGLTEQLSPTSTPQEIERYRLKLQFRADMLEAMLDATLTELEQLPPRSPGIGGPEAPSPAAMPSSPPLAIAGQESRTDGSGRAAGR